LSKEEQEQAKGFFTVIRRKNDLEQRALCWFPTVTIQEDLAPGGEFAESSGQSHPTRFVEDIP